MEVEALRAAVARVTQLGDLGIVYSPQSAEGTTVQSMCAGIDLLTCYQEDSGLWTIIVDGPTRADATYWYECDAGVVDEDFTAMAQEPVAEAMARLGFVLLKPFELRAEVRRVEPDESTTWRFRSRLGPIEVVEKPIMKAHIDGKEVDFGEGAMLYQWKVAATGVTFSTVGVSTADGADNLVATYIDSDSP